MLKLPDAVTLQGFGFADYRSFDSEGFIIQEAKTINIFIGQNNSGKSNILRAISLLRQLQSGSPTLAARDLNIDSHRLNARPPSAIVLVPLHSMIPRGHPTAALYESYRKKSGETMLIQWNTLTGGISGSHPLEVLSHPEIEQLHSHLSPKVSIVNGTKQQFLDQLSPILIDRAQKALQPLERFLQVPVFREIRTRQDDDGAGDVFNGHDIIGRLREMQHPRIGKQQDRDVFNAIQQFAGDLLGSQELRLEIPVAPDHIIVNMHGLRLPLESYGTGIHHLVLLCSALAIHRDYCVSIEEPEVHLHPDLQRKFLRFIATQTSNRYFITTHSNVFLDFHPNASVYHVTFDGKKSTVQHVAASPHARDVLTDMGYKASDLLQANGVIWVEGPSDRVYLNKWINLLAPDLIEGIHYAVAFYGGRVLAHFSCVDDPAKDLVEVLRINRHALLIMDRDGDEETVKLNASKERIRRELADNDACWVTQGREIENYLPSNLVGRYLGELYSKAINVTFTANTRLEEAIEIATAEETGPKIRYAAGKIEFARAFCEVMTEADLDVLDLRERLDAVIRHIRRWNHIEAEVASVKPTGT